MAHQPQTQQPQPKENTMQLAEILSDLVSLRACDPNAALALVSAAHPSSTTTTQDISSDAQLHATTTNEEDDPDLKRAKDLLELHYEVKQAHKRGELSRGLDEARRGVERSVGR